MCNRKSLFAWVLAAAFPLLSVAVVKAQDEPDPPSRAARISVLRGTVSLQPNGAPDWSQATPNYPMSSGDRLYADQDGRAELQVGNSAVRLGASTDLTVTDLTDNFLQLGLASGTIHLRTYGLNPGDSQEVDTPNGAILVTQPGDIRISSYAEDGGTTVEIFSGAVQLTGPDLSQTLYEGMTVQLSGTNPIYVSPMDFPAPDDFDAWSGMRDQRLLNSVSAQYVSRQMPGYDELDQYGQWDPNAEGYGPVWYPANVPYGWTPYSTGYWAQVGPWGWTWVDTTGPWGYAPFHYGRWVMIGPRWGWMPGPPAVAPVYSPALVAFAGGGGFSIGIGFGGGGVAAWFPLGPRDPFIPWYHCSNTYVTNVNITNVTIVNRTYINETIVNYNNNHETINNIHYANVSHVVAVPASSFSSGQPMHGSQIKLTPQQVQNIRPAVGVGQVPVREPAKPGQAGFRPVGLAAATHPVAAPAARPSVITPQGMRTTAPGSKPQPVPRGLASVNSTKPAPAPRPGAVTGNRPLPPAPKGAPQNTPKSDVVPAQRFGNAPPAQIAPHTQPNRPVPPQETKPVERPAAPPVVERTPAPVQRPVAPAEPQRAAPVERPEAAPRPEAEAPRAEPKPAPTAAPAPPQKAAKPAPPAKPAPKPKKDEDK